MALRYTRTVLTCAVIYMAGVHVNQLDHSLHRLMSYWMTMNANESDASMSKSESDTLGSASREVQLAFDQSYGFFDDMPQEDWEIHQDWARRQLDHRYLFQPSRHYGNPALWYYNNYNPIFNCPHAKRVWGVGDGPKWICDPHRLVRQAERRKAAGLPGPHCLIYSVGSNGNYEFEGL